jgi:hypothetical protein
MCNAFVQAVSDADIAAPQPGSHNPPAIVKELIRYSESLRKLLQHVGAEVPIGTKLARSPTGYVTDFIVRKNVHRVVGHIVGAG